MSVGDFLFGSDSVSAVFNLPSYHIFRDGHRRNDLASDGRKRARPVSLLFASGVVLDEADRPVAVHDQRKVVATGSRLRGNRRRDRDFADAGILTVVLEADGVLVARTRSVDKRVETLLRRNHAFGLALRIERNGLAALVVGGDQRRREFRLPDFNLPDVYAFAVCRDCRINAAFKTGGKSLHLRSARRSIPSAHFAVK
ncbi:hypothetical protein SDC9_186193 [bioreactor metagenome]|uniref:Uncharacterized protein n=1 Tax=bioreactor metagenome TaxID=1076179 RepID=A0A645HI08_9ZZZZ